MSGNAVMSENKNNVTAADDATAVDDATTAGQVDSPSMRNATSQNTTSPGVASPNAVSHGAASQDAASQNAASQDTSMENAGVEKVVLAYSGGLDTSVILKWLQETYGCTVATFTADLGQGDELEPARTKALAMGVRSDEIFIEDLREEFARDFVFPDVPGQRRIRRRVPARHIHRKAVDRQAIGRDSHFGGCGRSQSRRHRQRQRPGAIRVGSLRLETGDPCDSAMAHLGSQLTGVAHGLRRPPRDSHRTSPWQRVAVLDGRESAAHLFRGRPARGPVA